MPDLYEFNIEGHTLAALPINPGASGEPVILLHGITSSVYTWLVDPWPVLLEQGPCYALSLPGHYPARFPPGFRREQLTAEMMARILIAAIRQLAGDRPVTLIGHSTGGFAALDIAAHTPEIASRVVSIAGFARGRWIGNLGLAQRAVRLGPPGLAYFKLLYKLLGMHRALYRWAMRFYVADAAAFYAYPDLQEAVERTFLPFRQLDLDAMAHYFYTMPQTDISDLLPRITVATLVIAGDRDPIVPPEQSRLIADRVSNAELALMPGAGHMPFVERADDYQQALGDWLRRTRQ
jgi:pimeloyl-ACP methyl ester carboxylesterase